MKKYQSALALALLATTIIAPTSAHASDLTTEYTPTISINRDKVVNNKKVGAEGINFTITRVTLDKHFNFDLSDPSTYSVKDRLDSVDVSTDEKGHASVMDRNFLKYGYFEIREDGQKPFIVTLPFRDENDKLSDDLVIASKNGLNENIVDPTINQPGNNNGTNNGSGTNSGNDNSSKNNVSNVSNGNNSNTNNQNGIGNANGGNNGNIMQTSGMTSDSILKNIVLVITTMIAGSIAFIAAFKKKQDSK